MKKSLIALAVLGAVATGAQAQSNVQIGGLFQIVGKSYKVGDGNFGLGAGQRTPGQALKNEFRLDDDHGSRIWFKGTEDLGNGLSALFYMESRFRTDTGSGAFADGNTYVGLSSKSLGQLTFGRQTLMDGQGSSVETGLNGAPAMSLGMYAGKTILNYVNGTGIDTSRSNNVIQYASPNFSGFTVTAAVAASSGATEGTAPVAGAAVNNNYDEGNKLFLAGNYANGPIYVNLAYFTTKQDGQPVAVTAATADKEEIRLSASYLLGGGFKAGFQFDRATLETVGRTAAGVGGADIKRNAWQVPVSYTFGPHTIQGSFTKAGDISGTADSGAKMWVVGYDHQLSKRTNVGLFYSKVDNDRNGVYQPNGTPTTNGSTLLAGESASIVTLGMMHKF